MINTPLKYFELNNSLIYSYENLTDYLAFADKYSLSSYIAFYDKNKTINKSKLWKFINKFNLTFYCKNNICVQVNRNILPLFVEIPDRKGNIKRYITRSYTYDEIKLNKLGTGLCTYFVKEKCYIRISYQCNSDSQCLTNKCFNNYCVFNEENPTEFCTAIYINLFFRFSYIHCGKTIGDICKTDKECGSKHCGLIKGIKPWRIENYCGLPSNGPSDSDGIEGILNLLFLSSIIFIIYIILYFCFCCVKSIIKNKNKNKKL